MEVRRGETLWIAGCIPVLPILKVARENSGKGEIVKEVANQCGKQRCESADRRSEEDAAKAQYPTSFS